MDVEQIVDVGAEFRANDYTELKCLAAFAGLDGYDLAKRSLPGLPDKLAAEYAPGLMQAETAWPNDHMRRAAMGAQDGSLLAQNVASTSRTRVWRKSSEP